MHLVVYRDCDIFHLHSLTQLKPIRKSGTRLRRCPEILAWTIEYTATARTQLRKLDRQAARRIVDYMDSRVAGLDDPRVLGTVLTGPLQGLWRYRVGSCRVICEIQDRVLRVLVVRIGHRREIHR